MTDKATTYVKEIVFDRNALDATKIKVLERQIADGPHDLLDTPCLMEVLVSKTGYEYAQHVKAGLGDTKRGYAYFQENVQKPLIAEAQKTLSNSVKEQILKPASYTTNLTQEQFVQPVLTGAGLGAFIGFGWGLGQWNTPLEKPVEIRYINKPYRKDNPYAPLRPPSGKQSEE